MILKIIRVRFKQDFLGLLMHKINCRILFIFACFISSACYAYTHKSRLLAIGSHAPAYTWANPKIKPSSPPPLTGKQMGVVETIGVPPLGYEKDGSVKVFHLIAQPTEQWITDGTIEHKGLLPAMQHTLGVHPMNIKKKLRAWGYNGHTPGPTIEVTEGDRVRIIVKNELPEPTTVHWHGLEVPFAQDGSDDANPILPGHTHTYEFTVRQSGTYFYHAGFNIAKQEMYGLVGFFIIHPKEYPRKVDRHIAILMQEWALLPGNNNPNTVSTDFTWFTFNGRSAPHIPVINIKQNERVQIHFGTMMMDSHPIHIHGYTWTTVGTEGGPIKESAQLKGSTINVQVGTTRTVEFVAWNPGSWPLHCHKVHHVMTAHAEVPMGIMPHGGMFTFVNVIPDDPHKPWEYPGQEKPDNPDTDAFGYTKKSQNQNNKKVASHAHN